MNRQGFLFFIDKTIMTGIPINLSTEYFVQSQIVPKKQIAFL